MSGFGAAELRRLVQTRSAAMTESALRSGRVSPEEIQELDRLSRLLELQSKPDPGRAIRFPHVAAILGSTLLVVSMLLFARVRETAIELEIQATQVSFELADKQMLWERLALERLGASGLTRIELPDLARGEADILDSGDEGGQAIGVVAVADGDRHGSVGLTHIVPAARTHVTLGRTDLPREYRLTLVNPHLDLDVGVHGPVLVSAAGPQPVDFLNPRAIRLEAGSGAVDLDMTFRDLAHPGVIPQISVATLSVARVAEHPDDVSVTRRLSTIASGTLFFESLNGQQRTLRAGEALRFRAARGEIRALRLGSDHLTLNFQGRVRGMETGSLDNPHDLMPTWLDWLRAQHGLSLLWGSTFYLFGVALTVARWVRGTS
jgi:hypothetical protein